ATIQTTHSKRKCTSLTDHRYNKLTKLQLNHIVPASVTLGEIPTFLPGRCVFVWWLVVFLLAFHTLIEDFEELLRLIVTSKTMVK
uniref:Uncharacterized protein n=1 Tax=Neogobius melanostomus TaxID=47308 RepID=A0A8C6SGR5_9GOBI